MKLEEKLLRALSRDPQGAEYPADAESTGQRAPLSLLRRAFPDLSELVHGKRVLDFGCGEGRQAIALVQEEECSVRGLDTNEHTLARAVSRAREKGIPEAKLAFIADLGGEGLRESFDVVLSHDSMEHFPDPLEALLEMKSLLKPDGTLLISFGPPWLAPYGSHMHFFCRVPWVNVLFSEEAVMRTRSRYRNDGATRYEDVESGLNKMTVRKFEQLIASVDLRILRLDYQSARGWSLLGRIPAARELFINHVSCVLRKV